VNLGEILRSKREEMNLSIPEAALRTKIREDFITSIENGETGSIPPSYHDLFVKKYASFLNVELPREKAAAEKNDAIVDLLSEKSEERSVSNRCIMSIKRSLLFVYVHRKLAAILLFLLFFFLFTRHIYLIMNAGVKSEKSEAVVKIITIEGDPEDRISIDVKDSIILEDDRLEPFFLRISASDSCYICYYTDTLSVRETIIVPEKSLNLKAYSIIEAKLGKSNVVDLELDDVKVLHELAYQKNASSFIRATRSGADKIKRSDRISEYLKLTYGLE